MDVVDTFRVLRRRRWIVLPVLLLTLVLAALAMFSIPPEYTARSSLLVYGFDSAPSPVTPALLAASLQDGETVDELKGEGATAQYTVASDSSGFLTVTARSLEPSISVGTVNAVLEKMPETLRTQEDGFEVVESDRAAVDVINSPSDAVVSDGQFVATGSARLELVGSARRSIAPDTLRDSLTEVLQSAPVTEDLADQGAVAEYEVTFESSSPLIRIEAVSTDQDAAITTAALLTELAETEAVKLAGISEADDSVLTQPLVVAESASVSRKGPLRSVAAIAIVGLGLAICLAVAAEAYAQWRRNRSFPPSTPSPRSAQSLRGDDQPERDELSELRAADVARREGENRPSGGAVRTDH